MAPERSSRTAPTGRRLSVLLALCLAASLTCLHARTDRLRRAIHDIPGVPLGAADVAQDVEGFIWIAGAEGLARFDGVEAVPWAPQTIAEVLEYVSTSGDGRVCAGNPRGGLYEVVDDGAEPVLAASGEPFEGVRHAVYAADGTLWVLIDGRVLQRSAHGSWLQLAAEKLSQEYANRLGAMRDGGVAVGTVEGGLWHVGGGRALHSRPLARDLGGAVTRIVAEGADSILASVRSRGVVRVRGSETDELLYHPYRPTGLAYGDGAIWAVFGNAVFLLRDGSPPTQLTPEDGFAAGGSVLIDRGGALWITSRRGLELYPQPDTVIWNERAGGELIRPVSVTPDGAGGTWVSTWEGPIFRSSPESEWVAVDTGGSWSAAPGCLDGDGRIWTHAWDRIDPDTASQFNSTTLLRWDGQRAEKSRRQPRVTSLACEREADGLTWMVYGNELLRLEPGTDEPVAVAELPSVSRPSSLALDERLGAATGGFGGEFCLNAQGAVDPTSGWICEQPPGVSTIFDVAAGIDGRWWIATMTRGVLARTDTGWQPALPEGWLRDKWIYGLTPSPRGGLWIATPRERIRVEGRADELRIVERLSPANGVPSFYGRAIVEEPDGSLWIPGGGLVHVPATARRALPQAPPVRLTRLVVDGAHHALTGRVELSPGEHRLEAHFATFAYPDSGNQVYRMRLDTGPWSPLIGPSLQLVGLSAGRHTVEVEASVDGESWSAAPARLSVEVAREWYATGWAWLGFALAASALFYAVYRLRMAHVLRLERQRTTIAMDLHDEMGAAIGGIGIMAAVAADDGASPDKRQQVARKIAEAAEDLGASLYDIIWSLKIKGATFGDLAAQLIERGGRLFPGERPRFSTVAPEDWPAGELALPVRREVQRIVVEALHNAAKHSRASRVELGFEGDRDGCMVWVEDDGIGVHAAGSSGRGGRLGLDGMRRRAADIGARLDIGAGNPGGTRVQLQFRPDGSPWKPRRAQQGAFESGMAPELPVTRRPEEAP